MPPSEHSRLRALNCRVQVIVVRPACSFIADKLLGFSGKPELTISTGKDKHATVCEYALL